MKNIKVSSRDMMYFIFGITTAVFFSVFYITLVQKELIKNNVSQWLGNNKGEISIMEKEMGMRLLNFTGTPGTLWVAFELDKYHDKKVNEISRWLIDHQCPYGIVYISGSPADGLTSR